jgi:hypothetical protein
MHCNVQIEIAIRAEELSRGTLESTLRCTNIWGHWNAEIDRIDQQLLIEIPAENQTIPFSTINNEIIKFSVDKRCRLGAQCM